MESASHSLAVMESCELKMRNVNRDRGMSRQMENISYPQTVSLLTSNSFVGTSNLFAIVDRLFNLSVGLTEPAYLSG